MKNRFTQVLAIVLFVSTNMCWSISAQTATLLKDLVTGLEGSNPGGSYPEKFKTLNGVMYFAGKDKTDGPNNGHHLYKTDGTTEGTVLVKILEAPVTIYGGLTDGFTDFNGTVFFVHKRNSQDYQLWKTNGTEAGTEIVMDFASGGNSNQARPQAFTVIGNTMYFTANNGNGVGLWKTDGTTAGTVEVAGTAGVIDPIGEKSLIALNGKIYFAGLTGLLPADEGLFSSDGSTFWQVKSIDGTINSLTVFDNHLYFEVNGNLWKSDETSNGTAMVSGVSNINSLLVFNNELFVAGTDLYKIDGITNPLIANGTGGFIGANNDNFFTQGGYKSDGTTVGTISVPVEVSTTASFYVYNNKMYKGRWDPVTFTFDVWETDGTVPGTLKYITGQTNFGIINNQIIFLKYEVSVGIEPFHIGIVGGTNPTAPEAPTNLTATPTNSIELNWQDNSNDEDGFYIESTQDVSSGNWTQITSVGSDVTTYTHSGLNPGEDYFYRVQAYNSTGNSAYSNIASATEPLSVGDIEDLANSLAIYPNPNNGIFTIEVKGSEDNYELIVTNILGETVMALKNQAVKTEIDMSKHLKGTYFIQLKTNIGTVNKKIIIN